MPRDHDGPSDGISLGHYVEHLADSIRRVQGRVHVEQGVVEDGVLGGRGEAADDMAVDGAAEGEEAGDGAGGEGGGVGVVVGGGSGVVHEGVEAEGVEGEGVADVADEEGVPEDGGGRAGEEGVEQAAGGVEVAIFAELADAGADGDGLLDFVGG